MRDYLAQRGITAQGQNMVTRKLDTGAALLSKAQDLAIDLIVTGAYGGSRIRESLVGGATRHLFENRTRPVLFSH
jgi:nucleotide-binding universal stress UspA family protein